jgi:MFS family permease
MGKYIKKHLEAADEGKLRLINFVSFLLGFSQALLTYVASDYFRQSIGIDNVSVFYFIAYSISLILMLNLHKFINKLGKATVFFLFFFLQICFIALLIFAQPSAMGISLLILYIISANLIFVSLDIILEAYSEDRVSGRIRGLHLTVYNAGFILGPLLSTRLLSEFGFDGLFTVAMVIYMGIFIIGLLGLRGGNSKFQQKLTVSDLVKKIFTNRAIMRIYSIAFILDFFYAIMIVYTTLYLLDRGMSWNQLGIIFTIMLIPFVILQYPIGVLADKKFGEKEMMVAGIIIMGISAGSIFFIETNSVLVWGAVLFMTRVGAAMVEILRDSYFYKIIDGRDMDIISFFRTATSVGYMVATALSALLLVILPVKFVFLLIATVVLAGLYPALNLIDNKSEAELTKRKKYA